MASTNANPRIVYVNKVLSNKGLREMATRNDPKTDPIPTPAPISEIVARPAAIILDASFNIILIYLFMNLESLLALAY
jgi:hypothetical protein